MTRTFLLLAFISAGLSSCYKDVNDPPHQHSNLPTVPIEQELSFYLFDTGTYWIYENASTFERDTFSVTESEHGYFMRSYPWEPKPTEQYEYLKMTILKLGSTTSYRQEVSEDFIWLNPSSNHFGALLYYISDSVGEKRAGVEYASFTPSMPLPPNSFYNVKSFYIHAAEAGYNAFQNDAEYFWAPSQGLIKKVEYLPTGDEVWNLVESHIVPYP